MNTNDEIPYFDGSQDQLQFDLIFPHRTKPSMAQVTLSVDDHGVSKLRLDFESSGTRETVLGAWLAPDELLQGIIGEVFQALDDIRERDT